MDIIKIARILDAKQKIIDGEGKLPDSIKIFFKCGIVLFKRSLYDRGIHTSDIQNCEIEYADYSDEKLLKNYNELYKLITLKYGKWI